MSIPADPTAISAAQLYARLDRLPMTRVQSKILLQGGISTVLDGLDIGIVSFLLPAAATAFAMTGTEQGLFGSAALIGALLGDILLAVFGNHIGRKTFLVWSLVVYSGAIMLGAIAPDWGFLLATRFVAGIGIGISVNVVIPYLGEFAPPRQRAHYVGSLAGFFGAGFVLASLVAFLIPVIPDGWRWVQVLVGLPVILAFWWRRDLPESPRYLIMHGRLAEARAVVEAIETRVEARTGVALPPVAVTPASLIVAEEPFHERMSAQLLKIWSRTLWRRTTVLWVSGLVLGFGYYGFLTFLPTLLISRGYSVLESFTFTLIAEVAQVAGYWPAAWLSEKLDRKWALVIFLVLSIASGAWLAVTPDTVQIVIASVALGFFLNGAYAPNYVYTAELYPTESRAAGAAMSDAVSRVGAAVAPILVGSLYATIKFGGVFTMISIVLAVGAVVIAVLGVSTRGRSLEELSAPVVDPGRAQEAVAPAAGGVGAVTE